MRFKKNVMKKIEDKVKNKIGWKINWMCSVVLCTSEFPCSASLHFSLKSVGDEIYWTDTEKWKLVSKLCKLLLSKSMVMNIPNWFWEMGICKSCKLTFVKINGDEIYRTDF